MKKFLAAAGLLFLVGLPAYTQPVPKVETFFGYSYVRVNPQANQQHYTANGGTSQLVYNVNSWLGVVGDFSGYRRGRIDGVYVDNTWASFMAGPRISFAK